MDSNKKVVIIGAGFGGLQVAKGFKKSPLHVTVIDSSNHHLFQPLLYQVATAGRSYAVAELGKIHLSGRIAWLAWISVHIYYLIGFKNRILVFIQWAWAYFTFQRGARLIVSDDDKS